MYVSASEMDVRGRRLPSQYSPFSTDLKILQQYISDWKYGMALHMGEDPTSTGPEMRRIVKERIASALSEMDKITSEAREMSKELRKTSKFLDHVDEKEGNADLLQNFSKAEATNIERRYALEEKPAVESTTRSEFNKFLEYLAMEHKAESSELAGLNCANPVSGSRNSRACCGDHAGLSANNTTVKPDEARGEKI